LIASEKVGFVRRLDTRQPSFRDATRAQDLWEVRSGVAIVYGHLAGDASIEESAMLPKRLTGELREVDVVLRAKTAGHETVIAIEATGGARRATVDWVEQMIGKHKNLPTDKAVLVSESGFSRQGRTLARAEQMAPVTPLDAASDDLAREVVNALPSLSPKTVTLAPDSARVWVSRPDESGPER